MADEELADAALLLEVDGIETCYGLSQVLFGLSLQVRTGEMVAMMGRNGMGKTTTIRSILGLTSARSGAIRFAGQEVRKLPSFRIAQLGIGLVPEGRQIFPNLTVRENLIAASGNRLGSSEPWTLEKIHALFPRLAERGGNMGNTLSGGEQQMLAIGRALMARPKLLLLDEPSLGIAPILVDRIYETIGEINRAGVAILLVEQNANRALEAASRGYVLETGRVALADDSASLQNDPGVQKAYLGT
jgi:branched-chain amino acid transport system ATP-binding protein